MSDDFDPYYRWLGIPPKEQPADHYRLLGVPRYEEDLDVISNAADARMGFLRTFQSGPRGPLSQKLLSELAVARTTLLTPDRKAAYDAELRSKEPPQAAAVIPLKMAAPLAKARAIPQAVMEPAAKPLPAEATPRPAPTLPPTAVFNPATAPVIVSEPQPLRRQKSSTWLLPLVFGGVAVCVLGLALVVGLALSRGKDPEVAVHPGPSPGERPENNGSPPANTNNHSGTSEGTVEPKEKTGPDQGKTETPASNSNASQNNSTTSPPVNTTPASSASETANLLPLVMLGRDTRGHSPGGNTIAQVDKQWISLQGKQGFCCFVVPYTVPDNYEVTLQVTPRKGDGLLIGFPIAGRNSMISCDGFGELGQVRTAMETLKGRRPHDQGYPGDVYMERVLTQDKQANLTLQVIGNRVTFSCDGKTIFQWSGDPSDIGIYPMFDQRQGKQLFVGSWSSHYDIEKLTVKPLAGPKINVPPVVASQDTPASRKNGVWQFITGTQGKRFVLSSDRKIAFTYTPDSPHQQHEVIDLMARRNLGTHSYSMPYPTVQPDLVTAGGGENPFLVQMLQQEDDFHVMHVFQAKRGIGPLKLKLRDDVHFATSRDNRWFAVAGDAEMGGLAVYDTQQWRIASQLKPPDETLDLEMELLRFDSLDDELLLTYQNPETNQRRFLTFDWESGELKRKFHVPENMGPLNGARLHNNQLLAWDSQTIFNCLETQNGLLASAQAQGAQKILDLAPEKRLMLVGDAESPTVDVVRYGPNPRRARINLVEPPQSVQFLADDNQFVIFPSSNVHPLLVADAEHLLESGDTQAPANRLVTSTSPNVPRPNPNPLPTTGQKASWEWARYRGDDSAMTLSPLKDKVAFFSTKGKQPQLRLVDVTSGDLLETTAISPVDDLRGAALGPEPSFLFASSHAESRSNTLKLLRLVRSERESAGPSYEKMRPGIRVAFSSDQKLWAHSGGEGDPTILIRSTVNFQSKGKIPPPPGALAEVLGLYDDGEHLLVHYYGTASPRQSEMAVAVVYDWKTREAKARYRLPVQRGEITGMRIKDNSIYIWGRSDDYGAMLIATQLDGRNNYLITRGGGSLMRVTDVDLDNNVALLVDPVETRLRLDNFGPAARRASDIMSAGQLLDAKFVDQGKSVIALASGSAPIVRVDLAKTPPFAAIPPISELKIEATSESYEAEKATTPAEATTADASSPNQSNPVSEP